MVQRNIWHRSAENKVILGVCGGLAETWGTNPNLIRLFWVLGSLWTHVWTGVLLYLALSFLLPVRTGFDKTAEEGWLLGRNSRRWVGLILMLVGAWWLMDRFVPQIVGEIRKVALPLVLIGIGLLVVLRDYKHGEGQE